MMTFLSVQFFFLLSSLPCSSFPTLELRPSSPRFMPLTTYLLYAAAGTLKFPHCRIIQIYSLYLLLIRPMFSIFILSITLSRLVVSSLLSARMHAHAPSDFYCVSAAIITDCRRLLSWSLRPTIEDEGRPRFVCLVCRIHFPEGERSLIRAARPSSRLWQDLTCPASPLIAFK